MKLSEKIIHYKKVILNTPPHILFIRVIKRIYDVIRNFYRYMKALKGTDISDDYFLKKLGLKNKSTIYVNPFFSNIDIKDISPRLTKTEKNKIISSANSICNHSFDLLGSGKVKVSYKLKPKGVEGFSYDMRISSDKLDKIISNLCNL